MPGFGGELKEGEAGAQRHPRRANPPGADRDLGAGQGKRGGRTVMGNDSRRRHAVLGAGMSGAGWQVAGVGDVQVGGASHGERRWGGGEKREGFDDERLRMGRR